MEHIKNTKLWMRVFFVIACVSILALLWQWQQKHITSIKTQGGSFKEGVVGAPRFINPVLAREKSHSEKDLTQLLFGNILSVDSNGEYVYGLGMSLEVSENRKEYTLQINKNMTFHDGAAVTIDDVIFTIEKIQDPLIKSPLFTRWEGIEVEKIDTYSLVFKLIEPFSDFDKNLSLGILPKHIWENISHEEFIFSRYNTHPIGSGSYMLDTIKYQKTGVPAKYILQKSKNSNAYISKIEISFYENEEELVKAYRSKEIDAIYGVTANQSNRDLFDNEFSTTGPLPHIFGLFFNQNKQTLLKNKYIRNIFNKAINREDLIDEVFAGHAYPINSPLGRYNADIKLSDIEKDIAEIEKAGWKKNEFGIYSKEIKEVVQELAFDMSVVNNPEQIQVAEYIQSDLQEYGIKINLRFFDITDFHQKVIRPRDYDILFFGYMLEKETNLYSFWHSTQTEDPGLNISLYSNTKANVELKKLRNEKTSANMNALEKEITDDVPAVFVYSPAFTYLLPKKIKGERIDIGEKHDRFIYINDWYIRTRNILHWFIEK
ncbi:MAG: ABC transporter substrate-binding protein [Minisyncoccia bacterium]